MKALTALFAILTLGVFIVGVSLASPGTAPSASQFSQEASDSSQSTIKGGRLGESAMQFSPILRLADNGTCLKRGSTCDASSVCCAGLSCQELSPDLGGGWECQPSSGP